MSNASGRSSGGKFTLGNKFGGGNPFAGRAAKLRSAMLTHVTPKDITELIDCLLRKAKEGDIQAIREILDRTIGKSCIEPPPPPPPSLFPS